MPGLKKHLGGACRFPFFEYPTIRDLATWIDAATADGPWSCIVPIRPQGPGPPLYIVGGLYSEIFFCRQLLRHLKTDRPIIALEPDTQSGGLTRHARIEDVAHYYARAIRRNQPEGPYIIAGYSFGGLVAYELARQLTKDGQTIERLIILDPNPPNFATGPERQEDAPDHRSHVERFRPHPSPFRFFKPSWWKRRSGHWRRSYWRLKYVRLYEFLVRIHLRPPVSWRL